MKVKKRNFTVISCLFIFSLFVGYHWGFPKQQQIIIPFKVFSGLPVVKVNIQGHTFQLLLDLGAHFSSLSKESMKKVSLTKLSKTLNTMNLYGEKRIDPVFEATQVLIGNYLLPYLEFSESDGCSEGFELESPKVLNYGKIGREAFLDKALFIDRRKKVCIVEQAYLDQKIDPAKLFPGEWIETGFTLTQDKGISLCLITNLEEKRDLILDTGANVSIIHKNYPSKVPMDLRDTTESILLNLYDGTPLGEISFYPFNFSDTGLQGILGFDFLDHYFVCIDFLNNKIFLKRYKKKLTILHKIKTLIMRNNYDC